MKRKLLFFDPQFLENKSFLTMLQQLKAHNFLPIMVTQTAYGEVSDAAKSFVDSFICLNGHEIILDNQWLRSEELSPAGLEQLLWLVKCLRQKVILYDQQGAQLFDPSKNPNEAAQHLKQVVKCKGAIIPDSIERKEILYEDLLEEYFDTTHMATNTLFIGNKGITTAEAINNLHQKIEHETAYGLFTSAEHFSLNQNSLQKWDLTSVAAWLANNKK